MNSLFFNNENNAIRSNDSTHSLMDYSPKKVSQKRKHQSSSNINLQDHEFSQFSNLMDESELFKSPSCKRHRLDNSPQILSFNNNSYNKTINNEFIKHQVDNEWISMLQVLVSICYYFKKLCFNSKFFCLYILV